MIIPASYNYIGVFLTFNCNLSCPYCINKYDKLALTNAIESDKWLKALSRINTTVELPITLQGGEPTEYPDFYWLVDNLYRKGVYLDLLTNGDFNPYYFARRVHKNTFKRDAKYASIRFSFHPWSIKIQDLVKSVSYLKAKDYSVGIWGLDHPAAKTINKHAREYCEKQKIDFRMKEFLGWYNGELYGTYKYPDALQDKIEIKQTVFCKPSELLIAPDGKVYRCHHELYARVNSIGSILDKNFKLQEKFTRCSNFGACNPCDIKLKFDRFQESGHCSVEIKKGG